MSSTRHASASHARLHRAHKRGHSGSSVPSSLSPVADKGAFTFDRSVNYQESWNEAGRSTPVAQLSSLSLSASNKNKIKPYLRKLSSKDSNSLDLSRPTHENESLAGLAISDYSTDFYPRSVSDVHFTAAASRQRHARSSSNTSQFSTSSNPHRPTAPCMPSIRQTPQPYTPPLSKSTPPSVLGSENEADEIMTEEEVRLKQNGFDPARRSGSLSSVPGMTPPLRIHTTSSSTRLGGNYSQSSVSLCSPVTNTRSRGDTLKSIESTASPSSRTSFDKTFTFMRGGRDSPVDAASRAASIRAARQAFQEKEQAKERKYEKVVHKQAERDIRKQYRKDDRERRKSDAADWRSHKRSRSVSDSNTEKATPRPSIGGRQYSDQRQVHPHSLPNHIAPSDKEKRGGVPKVTKSRAAKSRWLSFITWFKTRLLRMSKTLHVYS